MKNLICVLAMALMTPTVSLAAEQVIGEDQVIVKEQKSVFKALLYRVCGRVH